ncbi:hypothetical protein DMENIID0001_011980 [Sergentomyia squamirostris]
MAAVRLSAAGTCRAGCRLVGHELILSGPSGRNPDLLMRNDFLIREAMPGKVRLKTALHSRTDWSERADEIIESGALTLYTDGSRCNESSGAGYCCPELDLGESVPLGRSTTVFQAETAEPQFYLFRGLIRGSALVLQCRDVLESISQECEVDLHWVPGHKGIQGNEEADRLASAGSSSPFVGPEPAVVGISLSSKRAIIREDMFRLHQVEWRSTTGCRISKIFMPDVSRKRTEYLVEGGRRKLRAAANLLTGHCLGKHLNRIGVNCNSSCRGCGESEETIIHYVGDCPSLAITRRAVFGQAVLSSGEISTIDTAKLMDFIRRTGWLDQSCPERG